MFTAVIFDMDGVLLDSEQWMLTSTEAFLNRSNIRLPREELLKLTGTTEEVYYNTLSVYMKMTPQECAEARKKYTEANPMPYGKLAIPGARDFVSWVISQGYIVGLATSDNKERTEEKFRQLDLEGFFPVFITEEMVEHNKPHPEAYLKVAKLLGVEPRNCLVIEDSAVGIAAGLAAGMEVAARRNASVPQDISQATYQFTNYTEVKKILINDKRKEGAI